MKSRCGLMIVILLAAVPLCWSQEQRKDTPEFERQERTTGPERMRLPDLTKEIRATSFVRVTCWISTSSSRRSSINRTSPSSRTALRP